MRKIALILLSMTLFASCNTNQKQAVEYNNNLVMVQKELAAKINQTEQQIAAAADSSSSGAALTAALQAIEAEQKKLDALQFNGDDFGMKAALSKAFAFMKRTYSGDYHKILSLKFGQDPEAGQKIAEAVKAIQQEGVALDRKFLDAQQQFAKKHNIRLLQQ
ncbi:LIC11966 family surface protein [Niabella drilacis]|uniref:DUF4142 domain-containing protein n=1 Tax=Niabella drilacis (strain DSM 25811 / CCM 8410 / CCUG 62505 / LMG 26954 / E90) TaxID=1285928 RepID=A0A1G6SB86_NIADE|nr:hypothetical protein [Niabella drilacis]SDD14180.1 hypothetical protein SAMN04487894_106166 [Niabella drilacis]